MSRGSDFARDPVLIDKNLLVVRTRNGLLNVFVWVNLQSTALLIDWVSYISPRLVLFSRTSSCLTYFHCSNLDELIKTVSRSVSQRLAPFYLFQLARMLKVSPPDWISGKDQQLHPSLHIHPWKSRRAELIKLRKFAPRDFYWYIVSR